MARLVTGTLRVESLSGGVEPGTYDFENATYLNLADLNGDGAYAVQVGFAVYLAALNTLSFETIPGVFHRYRITALTINSFDSISGTLAWDEPGEEQDAPAAPTTGIISQKSAGKGFAFPALESVYSDLPNGIGLSALALDMVNIVDTISGGGSGGDGSAVTYVHTQASSATSWVIDHNKNADFTATVFDEAGNAIVPDSIVATTSNRATLTFSAALAGKAVFVFA